MMKSFTYGALTIAAVLVGCGGNPPAMMGNDAGPTGSGDSGPALCGDPGAPYGTSEGSHFLPFTLNRCDGTPFEFYADGYCDSSLTVVSIAAGWCGPCRMEAPLLRQIEADYRDQGVRVLSIIIQNNSFGEPSPSFCNGWVSEYSFEHPTLLDPTQETQIYLPMGALPATLVVDAAGTIRHREYGVSANLASLRGTLDTLLAE